MIISIPNVLLRENIETQLKFRLFGKENLSEKPTFRFIVTEITENQLVTESNSVDQGWVFPVVAISENAVMVKIPPRALVLEKKYYGKLEVVVGSRYYTPAQVILESRQSSIKNTQLGMVMDRSLVSEQDDTPLSPGEPVQQKNPKTLQGTIGTKSTASPKEKTPRPQAASQGHQQASRTVPPPSQPQRSPPPNPLITEQKKKELLKKKLLGMFRDALVTIDGHGPDGSRAK